MGTSAKTLLLILTIALAGCASPGRRLEERALALGLEPLTVQGEGFIHQAYRNRSRQAGLLHVYLEGDGSPWLNRWTIAPDPTPRRPLMLELLALDPAPAVYLGRPCYHDRTRDPDCHPWLWTAGRYSLVVVDSLAGAVTQLVEEGGYAGVVLLGHSGGGVLAMLLAERLADTRAVVTVAANLDIDRWTDHHDYSPLVGSLNPTRQAPLGENIVQVHLAGERDYNVPLAVVQAGLAGQPQARLLTFADFDHGCCWRQVWPDILDQLARQLSAAGPRPDPHGSPGP